MVLKNYIKKFNDGGKADGKSRREQAFNFFVSKGYSPEQALGIIGNLVQESTTDLKTNILGFDGSGSFGIAQWLGPRKQKLMEIRPNDYKTFKGQLEFIDWELRNTEKRAADKLRSATTPEEATLVFSKYYERPHRDFAKNDKRIEFAKMTAREVGYLPKRDSIISEAVKETEVPERVIESTGVRKTKIPTLATQPITREETQYTSPPVTRSELLRFDLINEIDAQRRKRELEILNQYQTVDSDPQKVQTAQDLFYGIDDDGFDPYNYIQLEEFQEGGKKPLTEEEMRNINLFINKLNKEGLTEIDISNIKGETADNVTNLTFNLVDYFTDPLGFLPTLNPNRKESQYRPSVSKNPNQKYYTYKGLRNDVIESLTDNTKIEVLNNKLDRFRNMYSDEEYIEKVGLPKDFTYNSNFNTLHDFFKNITNNLKSNQTGSNINLGQHRVTAGEDEKGKYLSIHDKYDWDVLGPFSPKGWEIYDRIYEEDFINKNKNGQK